MPRKKYRIQTQSNYDMLDDVTYSNRSVPRDEDKQHIKDVATAKDVPFRDQAKPWLDWEFKLKRGGQQKKLEGWERKCVEAYVMGWLTYHDMEIEGKSQFDHDIFFEWIDDNPNKKTNLQVHIDPKDL